MKFVRRILYFVRQRRMERELAEELEFHRELSGAAAFGNMTLAREDARAVWIWPWLQSVWQDVCYGVRALLREPGFTLPALLALGSAIGINASLFTVYNAIAIRSWSVKDPASAVRIFVRSPNPANGVYGLTGVSVAEFRYLAAHTQTLEGLVSMAQRRVSFGFESFGRGSTAVLVAADHFKAVGADLALGRGFLPEEDVTGAPVAVMVLSYDVWKDHFGSDPAILGKRIPVNDVPFTVVGVAPEELNLHGESEDLYIPFPAVQLVYPNDPSQRQWLTNANSCCEPIGGRLRRNVSREEARAELEVLDQQFRSGLGGAVGRGAKFVLTRPTVIAGEPEHKVFRIFGAMFVGVTLLVLLACANVGNLLVARSAARRREIEVRRAVGAGRARIIRQLLTESLLLAAAAGVLGVAIASRLPMLALTWMSDDQPPPAILFRVDSAVLAYVTALAFVACLAFGLAPALHGTNPRVAGSRLRLRGWFLASQVALSMVLLSSAGLMFRGVQHAAHQDPGFVVNGVLVTSFELPAQAMNEAGILRFANEVHRQISQLGMADSFALSMRAPMEGQWSSLYRLPEETREQLRRIETQQVLPGYFKTLGIPLLAGRDFELSDQSKPVIVVNETVARHWGESSALGKSLVIGGIQREIIGVAKNTHSADLDEPGPAYYAPLGAFDVPKLLLRSPRAGAAAAVEALAARVEPRTRAQTVPLSTYVDKRLEPLRAGARIAATLGGFGLALATIGMFGVFAYAVQQRTKEIGIRMALGARAAQVVGLVVGGTSRSLGIGLVVGFVGAAGAARMIAEYLYGVSPFSPGAYLVSAAILGVAGLGASYLPCRRAARVDPVTALRHE